MAGWRHAKVLVTVPSTLKYGWNSVYLKYWTLNLMPVMVYPIVLFGVEFHQYIQC